MPAERCECGLFKFPPIVKGGKHLCVECEGE